MQVADFIKREVKMINISILCDYFFKTIDEHLCGHHEKYLLEEL